MNWKHKVQIYIYVLFIWVFFQRENPLEFKKRDGDWETKMNPQKLITHAVYWTHFGCNKSISLAVLTQKPNVKWTTFLCFHWTHTHTHTLADQETTNTEHDREEEEQCFFFFAPLQLLKSIHTVCFVFLFSSCCCCNERLKCVAYMPLCKRKYFCNLLLFKQKKKKRKINEVYCISWLCCCRW